MPTDDLVLRRAGAELRLTRAGGRITGYTVGGAEIIAGVQSAAGPFAFRSALLAPWPNRVTRGRWEWQGQALQLQINHPESSSALHGLVVTADFDIAAQSERSVTFTHDMPPHSGYPFPIRVEATYTLADDGVDGRLDAINLATEPIPIGLGVHPYVDCSGFVDGASLALPARRVLVTDDEWNEIERRPVDHSDDDFRSASRLQGREIDAAFTDLERAADGRVHAAVTRPDGLTVEIWGGDTCRWLVVYTGDTLSQAERRRSVCVEPMTCGPNALRTKEIDVVAPGERLRLDWGIGVHPPE